MVFFFKLNINFTGDTMLFLKGLIIGIGKTLPGVSGSLMAISMNIYAPLLEAISTFFKNIKKNIKFLLPILLGIFTSIIFLSKLLNYLINNYYFPILLLFIGLILGSINVNQVSFKQKKQSKILTFTLSFLLVIFIERITFNITLPDNFLTNFFLGIIETLSTIIPGISGTAIYMAIGKYETIIESFANPLNNIPFFIPFGIGIVLSLLIISKLLTNLLKKNEELFLTASLGFTFSTLLIMYLKTLSINKTLPSIIIGELLLIIGFIISKKLNKL